MAAHVWSLFGRAASAVSVGVVAGLTAGAVAGGIGSRVAMRIAGALSIPCTGLETEAGFDCGEISVFGVIVLIILGATLFGVPGGLIYTEVRPWVVGLGRWHGLVLGALLLLTFGPNVISSDNTDFQRFTDPS